MMGMQLQSRTTLVGSFCCTSCFVGSSSPFARTGRGNSISSHRPLLPDAVFVPENPTHGPLQHKHSGCNVTFLPDHVFLQESSTEAVCSDAEDGEAALVGLLR